jgi:nitrogen regulatory protein P-II 1
MHRIVAIFRPHRLEQVKSAVAALGITGMTVTDARGTGTSPEVPNWFGGEEQLIAMPIKTKMELVVSDELVEPVIETILDHARTGEPGDRKIFVERLEDAVRIRTGERGEAGV